MCATISFAWSHSSKEQQAAILSFLPMLAMFNDVIARLSTFFYTGQVSGMIGSIGNIDLSARTVIVMCVNAIAALTAFLIAYRKKLKA